MAGSGITPGDVARKLDPIIEQLINNQSLPGLAIGIVADGTVVYAKAFSLKSLAREGDPVTTSSLTTPGLFEYYCSVHPHMKGKVIVEPQNHP